MYKVDYVGMHVDTYFTIQFISDRLLGRLSWLYFQSILICMLVVPHARSAAISFTLYGQKPRTKSGINVNGNTSTASQLLPCGAMRGKPFMHTNISALHTCTYIKEDERLNAISNNIYPKRYYGVLWAASSHSTGNHYPEQQGIR